MEDTEEPLETSSTDLSTPIMLTGGTVMIGFRAALFAAAARAGMSVNEYVLRATGEKLRLKGADFSGVFEPGDIAVHRLKRERLIVMSEGSGLEDRIADAFASEHTSAELTTLLLEVATAEQTAKDVLVRAKAAALDPATRPQAVAQARQEMQDSEFAASRMSAATAKLKELLAEARVREEADRRRVEYDDARKERDGLAAELARVYPPIAEALVDLLGRVEANDRRCEAINRTANAADHLATVEKVARRAPAGWPAADAVAAGFQPVLTARVRIPPFFKDGPVWPKPIKGAW